MTGVADGGGGGDHHSSNLEYGDQGFTNSQRYLKNSAAERCHTAPPSSLQPTGSLQGGGWRVEGGGWRVRGVGRSDETSVGVRGKVWGR